MARSIFIAKNPTAGSRVPSTTASDWIETPITNESVKPTSSATESAIIRADRQPQDQVRTGFEVGGTLNSEMMFGAYEHLILGAMGVSSFTQVGDGENSSITLTVTAGTKTLAGTGIATNAAVGDWIRLENEGEANHGLVARIATRASADSITVDSVSGTLVDETSTTGYNIRLGARATIGTVQQEFAYAKKITDASGDTFYEALLGMLVNGWTLQAAPNSILTTSFEFLGRTVVPDFDGTFSVNADGEIDAGGTAVALATYLSSGFTAAPSNKVYNAIRNARVILDGVYSTVATNLQFTLSNNAFGEPVIGVQGNKFVEFGNASFTGSLEAVIDDTVLYEKFINDTPGKVALYLVDADDQGYIIDVPSIRLNDGGTSIPGQTGTIKLPLQFGAGVDSTTGRALSITKLDPNAIYT